jgi:hypothetical protein
MATATKEFRAAVQIVRRAPPREQDAPLSWPDSRRTYTCSACGHVLPPAARRRS